ncbi:major centromere autoantigen B-like [Asterias amurensis]|uniref:major centromere autoantigen B-like n=1 Tax=Asterias amurensis TaxID=7602 RepID=UPI003AB7B81C
MCETTTLANGIKRLPLSLEKKLEIIKAVEEHPEIKKAEVARQFGIASSTLWTILKKRKEIVKCSKSFEHSCKRMRLSIHSDIEKSMLLWMQKTLAKKLPVTSVTIRAKARELAMELGRNNFKASWGWLCRFRKRHQVLITQHLQPMGTKKLAKDSSVKAKRNSPAQKERGEEPAVELSMDESYEDAMIHHSPSTNEAFHYLARLQDFFNNREESSNEDFLRIAGLEASLVQCGKNDQQSKITDYFHP